MPLDQQLFRDVIGRFASGVTVITTRTDGQDFGTTASAVSSLSMEPPMLLVCLNRTSETGVAIGGSGWFAVNILAESQADLAYAFARKAPDKFGAAELLRGPNEMPLLPGALAQITCRVSETAIGGTHTVFLGAVEDASAGEGEPLTYYRGQFGRFEDTRQNVAYARVRDLVIHRDLPRDEPLEVEHIAAEHELDPAHVFYALTRLTTDGLVVRRPDEHLVIRALDVRAAHEAVDARCAIEIAVVETVAGAISDADVAVLRGHATMAQAAARADPPDSEGLVVAAHAFHTHFIGLLDNAALLSFFARLDLQAVWRRALPPIQQRGRPSASYLTRLLDATAAGDRETAKDVLRHHAETVKKSAREAIESLGGEL